MREAKHVRASQTARSWMRLQSRASAALLHAKAAHLLMPAALHLETMECSLSVASAERLFGGAQALAALVYPGQSSHYA